MKTDLRLDHDAPVPGRHLALRVLLRMTGDVPPEVERAPMHLAVVLDRSGSMHGAKLDHAKRAAAHLVRRLRPDDAVSVVSYDHQVQTLAAGAGGLTPTRRRCGPSRPWRPGARRTWGAGGSRGARGWPMPAVRRLRPRAGIRRILLMTDGLANQGIVDPGELRELCGRARAEGITTTTIGFGAGYNEDLLRAMADAGGGATWYVEHANQAAGIFAQELEGLLSLSAQDLTVTVFPAPGVRFMALRHDYPHAPVAGGGVRIAVGDLSAQEPRLALMEFLVPPSAGGADVEQAVGTLRVSARVVTAGGGLEHRTLDLPVRLRPGVEARVDPLVAETMRLLDGARAREEALMREAAGDWVGAVGELRGVATELAVHSYDPAAVREAHDLEMMADQLEALQGFDPADLKYMKQRAWDSRRSREGAKDLYSR
jgi:Ca-activated chloride channel homolog